MWSPSHCRALHSESQEPLLEMALNNRLIDMTWEDFRAIRFGFWIKSPTTLRDYCEKIGMALSKSHTDWQPACTIESLVSV